MRKILPTVLILPMSIGLLLADPVPEGSECLRPEEDPYGDVKTVVFDPLPEESVCRNCHLRRGILLEGAPMIDMGFLREEDTREFIRQARENPKRSEKDRLPPTLTHESPIEAEAESTVRLIARANDPAGVDRVVLFLRPSDSIRYRSVAMEPAGPNLYEAVLGPELLRARWVKYYIQAWDREGNGPAYVGSENRPILVPVRPVEPPTPVPIAAGIATLTLISVGALGLRRRIGMIRLLEDHFWARLTYPLLTVDGEEFSDLLTRIISEPVRLPSGRSVRMKRTDLLIKFRWLKSMPPKTRRSLLAPAGEPDVRNRPHRSGGPRRKQSRSAALCLAAVLSFVSETLPGPISTSPMDLFGVAIYDRYGTGMGNLRNNNKVRLLNNQGNSIHSLYRMEQQSALPTARARTFNRGIALDVHPDPDPQKAAAGVTFVRYIYVTDPGNHRIRRFEFGPATGGKYRLLGNANQALYLSEWGSFGGEVGRTASQCQFRYPRGIAVHPISHDVYVADTMNSRIQVFEYSSSTGDLLLKPVSLEVAVWTGSNYRTQKVTSPGDHTLGSLEDWRNPLYPGLEELGKQADILNDGGDGIGVAELGQGFFYYPQAIAIDVDTRDTESPTDDVTYLYVADTWNHRIQMFKDTTPGYGSMDFRFARMWGGYLRAKGAGSRERFAYPRGITVSRNPVNPNDTRIYVLDWGNRRVQVFRKDMNDDITFFGAWGDDRLFVDLQGIAADGSGNIYISDPANHLLTNQHRTRIQRWTRDGTFQAYLGAVPLNSFLLSYGLAAVTTRIED